ncbi:hypothetical protein C7Y44_16255 [Paenibacillus popilliae]|uniref:Uncharacterized protein n=1 Tax=Paenibacillus popilliae TaxID=78057 RepID=A0ABY3AN08_PAEPP|nr:hypothetical protein C7Y44_16255 [Paenibacillus sp. SDF0028]
MFSTILFVLYRNISEGIRLKLEDLQGDYDVIVGVGTNCKVSHQLKKNGIRSFADPFLIGLFLNQFRIIVNYLEIICMGFLKLIYCSNLKHENNFVVKDNMYTCLSIS